MKYVIVVERWSDDGQILKNAEEFSMEYDCIELASNSALNMSRSGTQNDVYVVVSIVDGIRDPEPERYCCGSPL